jgi:hypothetical protein
VGRELRATLRRRIGVGTDVPFQARRLRAPLAFPQPRPGQPALPAGFQLAFRQLELARVAGACCPAGAGVSWTAQNQRTSGLLELVTS